MDPEPARQNDPQGIQPADVLLYVEQDAPSKLRIRSDHLEQIGAKLRGPRRFSIFYSLVLPALVTLLTTILTGTFQYLSWSNTVHLQAATAVADRASETFDKSAALIGQRSYATLVFIPSLRDMAQLQAPKKTQDVLTTNQRDRAPRNQADNAVFTTASSDLIVDPAPQFLTDVNDKLRTRRYEAYYGLLKLWNEGYDQLIADIDYNLDRPIMADAEIPRAAITVFSRKLSNIKCQNSLPEELEKVGLDKHSLKIQFAAINHCFRALHQSLDDQIAKLLNHSLENIDLAVLKAANGNLADIETTANEFRCVALLRIGYYKAQTERSIAIPGLVRHWMFDPVKAAATKHFQNTDQSCNPQNRPT
jgi:hypothetical protein